VAALDRLSVVLVFILAVVFLGEAFSGEDGARSGVGRRRRDPAHVAERSRLSAR
jgi:hypothetical protein